MSKKTHCVVLITAKDEFEVLEVCSHADALASLTKLRGEAEGLKKWDYAVMPYERKQPLFPPNTEIDRHA